MVLVFGEADFFLSPTDGSILFCKLYVKLKYRVKIYNIIKYVQQRIIWKENIHM